MIRPVTKEELPACVDVIHASFATVAAEFSLTQENCPGYAGFIPLEKLDALLNKGVAMFGLFERGALAGFVALENAGAGVFYLEKLAVLPSCRHRGFGTALMDFARDWARGQGGKMISIGIIEENLRLKDWYARYGFRHTGVKRFDHLPFTVGFMELDVRRVLSSEA